MVPQRTRTHAREMELIQKIYFTDEAVNDFLVHKLDFGNWKIILHRCKLEFLTYLLQKHLTHVYFQNIRLASVVPVSSRAAPTLEEIITNGFSGRGGVCFELNYFLHLLLVAVGFDTFVVGATFDGGVKDSHLVTIVRLHDHDHGQDAREEKLYLLDVASANPMELPVPLHELPHRRQAGGVYYEFRAHERLQEGKPISTHGRYQIGGGFLQKEDKNLDKDKDRAVLRFEFDLTPRTLEDFQVPMREIFTNPDATTIFLSRPFLFRYLKHEFTEPDNNEWVLVFGQRIVTATKTGRQLVQYKNYDEMKLDLWKYFPKLEKEEMRLAFELFEKVAREEVVGTDYDF